MTGSDYKPYFDEISRLFESLYTKSDAFIAANMIVRIPK
jgi:hypothetical protein